MADSFIHGIEQTENPNVFPQVGVSTQTVAGFVGTATDSDAQGAEPLAFNTPTVVLRPDELTALGIESDSYLYQAVEAAWCFARRYFPVVVCRSQGGHTEGEGEGAQTITAQADMLTAIAALEGAEAHTGYKPTLLGCESSGTLAIDRRLAAAADILRAVAYVDAPDTYTAEAPQSQEVTGKNAAKAYAGDLATSRAYALWPKWRVLESSNNDFTVDESLAGSLLAIGLTAKVDATEKGSPSPSNHTLDFSLFPATLIPATVVPFDMSAGSLANELNEAHVATWVYKDGWRLWGNRTTALTPGSTSAQIVDAQYSFLPVRRQRDRLSNVIDSIALAAVDKGITSFFGEFVTGSANAEFRAMAAGDNPEILYAECAFNRADNPDAQLKVGTTVFVVEWTPVYTAEKLSFRHSITDKGLARIFGQQS